MTNLAEGETAHVFPRLLPNGKQFLFYVIGSPVRRGVYLGSLGESATKRLIDSDAPGAFLKPDRVLFTREGALLARRFDLSRQELVGESTTIAYPVSAYAVSRHGEIAYRTIAGDVGLNQLTWENVVVSFSGVKITGNSKVHGVEADCELHWAGRIPSYAGVLNGIVMEPMNVW